MESQDVTITFRCPAKLRSEFNKTVRENYSKMSIELRKLMQYYSDNEGKLIRKGETE